MYILIVEDEQAIAHLYKTIVESAGYRTTVCHTPDSAITAVRNASFDFAFIDLMLPDMRGEDLLESLRRINTFKDTPVVITTNLGSGFDVNKLKKMKVKDILLKVKAGPDEILESISKYT